MYEAKYFPNTSLFDAKVGYNPSYTWRGIWEAIKVLKQGYTWRIGNEKLIKVFKDPWILSFTAKELIEHTNVEEWDTTVASLIDDNSQWWNVDKVRALFNPNIAVEILKLTICPNSNDKQY